MSLSGKLDQFNLADLLQLLTITGRSGKLNLSKPHRRGLILMRRGKVVYAANLAHREALGSLLICRELITEAQLRAALAEQNRSADEELRLGTVLVDMGVLTRETLEEVIRKQTLEIVRELMEWGECYFRFETMEVLDLGEVGVDVSELVLGEGMSSDAVLLSLVEELDSGEPTAGDSEAAVSAEHEAGQITVGAVLDALPAPQFTGEIASQLLQYSRDLAERVAFFVIRGDYFAVVGHSGCADSLDGFTVPMYEASILHETAERMTPTFGPLEETLWNSQLVQALGGERPSTAIASPVIANGLVVMLVYADRLRGESAQATSKRLEALVSEAGEEIERRLGEQRAKQRLYLASS